MKVNPRTCSGVTRSLATSQTTRAAIVSVLPEPAPAMTAAGCSAGLDHLRLLVGRLGAQIQQPAQVGSADHDGTCRPGGCTGQLVRTSQIWHRPFTVARNCPPRMRAAMWSTTARAHCGSVESASGCCACSAIAAGPAQLDEQRPARSVPSSANAPCSIASW